MEEEHSAQLRRLSKATMDGLKSREARQGSYAMQLEEVIRIHERMSNNGTEFRLNVQQMGEDLEGMAHEMERGRKQWKHDALQAESRLQDAERALDKAKQKYDSLANDYDHAKTGDKVPGGKFSLRPKSAAQQEEDLHRKLGTADADYQTKIESAQQMRQDVEKNSRPQAVQILLQLIQECDSGVALQLQKFGRFTGCLKVAFYSQNIASFNERLLLGNGLLISPLAEGDNPRKGLRDIIAQIDNERDFHSYITSFTSQVPPPRDIKYEKHPVSKHEAIIGVCH
jgi:Rho GTPase-activating protein RGD1